jgi:hypothetical protein
VPDTVEFAGDSFRMGEKIALMALMRFAKVAKSGTDADSLDGLTSMYELLEQCLHAEDWERFQQKAVEVKADGDELMQVVSDVIATLSGRPTSRPSGSSDGPTVTKPKSEDDSYLRVVKRLEDEGRPDQAYMVQMAHEEGQKLSLVG